MSNFNNADYGYVQRKDFYAKFQEVFPSFRNIDCDQPPVEGEMDDYARSTISKKMKILKNYCEYKGVELQQDTSSRDLGDKLYYSSMSLRVNVFGYWLMSQEGEKHTKLFSSISGDNKIGYTMFQMYQGYKEEDGEKFMKAYLALNDNEPAQITVAAFLCYDYFMKNQKGV